MNPYRVKRLMVYGRSFLVESVTVPSSDPVMAVSEEIQRKLKRGINVGTETDDKDHDESLRSKSF